MNYRYFIGPMSKNVVDTIIDFCEEHNQFIGLIPSRRQVEWDGGYVNHKWKTGDFSNYVRSKTNKIILERDHSGPGQGRNDDSGFESLKNDCYHLDMIHIDPWKKYSKYEDGLKHTVDMIVYCNSINPNLFYEVGTEESIRRFEVEDLERLILDLKLNVGDSLFNKIKYLVIQSGTSLKGNIQTGNYDRSRLCSMVGVAKRYGLLSKEHNGDYIPVDIIREKFSLGLDSINIAPEFGLIETQTYLDHIEDVETFNNFWTICYESRKWEKWVNKEFDPITKKEDLIKICGHYVLTESNFISKIKNKFPNIDNDIKSNIKNKLNELFGY